MTYTDSGAAISPRDPGQRYHIFHLAQAKRGACLDRKELATIATDTKVCMDVQVPEESPIFHMEWLPKKKSTRTPLKMEQFCNYRFCSVGIVTAFIHIDIETRKG